MLSYICWGPSAPLPFSLWCFQRFISPVFEPHEDNKSLRSREPVYLLGGDFFENSPQ